MSTWTPFPPPSDEIHSHGKQASSRGELKCRVANWLTPEKVTLAVDYLASFLRMYIQYIPSRRYLWRHSTSDEHGPRPPKLGPRERRELELS